MRERWPKIAAWFGLVGTGPVSEPNETTLLPGQYIQKHAKVLVEKGLGNLVWKPEFLDSYGFYLDFDRQIRLDKCQQAGFIAERDPNEGWFEAFEKFKRAGMILSS